MPEFDLSKLSVEHLKRRLTRLKSADVSKMTPEQRKAHDRKIEVTGRHCQARLSPRKELSLEAHKRDRPGLPG